LSLFIYREERTMKDFGALARDDRLRPLNAPRALSVTTDKRGRPTSVARIGPHARGATAVESILDRWRIDDEWWRREVSRMYYQVALEGGQTMTIFQDLLTESVV
jgi:hypothetical protein